MVPTLVQIGPFPLHSYGVLLALSFFLGIVLASRRAPARGIAPDAVFDASLVIVFAAILGARFLYVLFHRDEMHRVLDVVALWTGGLAMYGGVLAAFLASAVYLRRKRIPFLVMADVVAPSLGLGLGLTRIGCFLNGCCFGHPTTGPLGVRFPADSFVGRLFEQAAVHPTQLYSSATGWVILGLVWWFDRKPRRTGQVFGLYLVLDAVGRFILDFFRYYESNSYLLGRLTVNQLICLGLFAAGAWLLIRARGAAPAALLAEVPAAER
jgi:phosphatidylglycerol:prolipoprotein diacylglycerol transferase